MTGREITELVLVLACVAAIITVLIVAAWQREDMRIKHKVIELGYDRAHAQPTVEQPFSPGTERAIMQALLLTGAIDRSAGRDRQGGAL